VLCLFCSQWPHRTAQNCQIAASVHARWTTCDLGEFVPAQAIIWPRAHAEAFREWSYRSMVRGVPDDIAIARWAMVLDWSSTFMRKAILCHVPSLVEHVHAESSAVGNPGGPHRRALMLAAEMP
jgi:hypothetical protein